MSKPRKTAIDRAIASFDAEIAVLQAARQKLIDQQAQQVTRKARKPKAADVPSMPERSA